MAGRKGHMTNQTEEGKLTKHIHLYIIQYLYTKVSNNEILTTSQHLNKYPSRIYLRGVIFF